MKTARLESMSRRGFMSLIREDDGDIIIAVAEEDRSGVVRIADVQFCTAGIGGGGSKRTHAALLDLMAAMAADNLDKLQDHRRPDDIDDDVQQQIIDWHDQVQQSRLELRGGSQPSASEQINANCVTSLLSLLKRVYESYRRCHWEEGQTLNEAIDEVLTTLSCYGVEVFTEDEKG